MVLKNFDLLSSESHKRDNNYAKKPIIYRLPVCLSFLTSELYNNVLYFSTFTEQFVTSRKYSKSWQIDIAALEQVIDKTKPVEIECENIRRGLEGQEAGEFQVQKNG